MFVVTITLFALSASVSADSTKSCEDIWRCKNCKCYKFVGFPGLDWSSALARCKDDNATLAVIHDQEHQDFVNEIRREKHKKCKLWIGLYVFERNWSWSDKSNVTYTNWCDEELNSTREKECAVMRTKDCWHKNNCTNKRKFICEKPFGDWYHNITKRSDDESCPCVLEVVPPVKTIKPTVQTLKGRLNCSKDGKDAYGKASKMEFERGGIEASCTGFDVNISGQDLEKLTGRNFVVSISGQDLEDLNGNRNAVSELDVKERNDYDAPGDLKRVSGILSIELKSDGITYSIPVKFKLKYREISDIPQYSRMVLNESKICGFWNKSDHAWSDEGCEVLRTDKDNLTVECFCAHTTSYAILVKFDSCSSNKVFESVITWLGLAISSLALVLALLIYFTLRKKLTATRFTIHRHLMIAVLCTSVTFLVGASFEEHRKQAPKLCEMVATLRYFCCLVIFMWMLIEGIHMFRRIVLVFQGGETRIGVYIFVGWGIPLVVTLTLFIKRQVSTPLLETCNLCWFGPKSEPVFFWILFATVILVCSINFVIMVYVTSIVTRASEKPFSFEEQTLVQVKASIRSCLMLIILLGLPWIISPLLNIPFPYRRFVECLFIIFNTLQGLFVAVIHCFANTEVKDGFKRRTEKKSYSMEILEKKTRKSSIATQLSELR